MFPLGKCPRATLLVLGVMAMVLALVAFISTLTVAPMMSIVLGLLAYVWQYTSGGMLPLRTTPSPVAVGQWSPVLGFVIAALFAFSVHTFDRQGNATVVCVQDKCRRISVCLTKLHNRLVATIFIRMLWVDMVLTLEKEIVTILSDAEPAELNGMLPKVRLGLICYKVKDHKLNLHRTMLLDLLAVSRLSKVKLCAHRNGKLYAKNIILYTKRRDLSELKTLTDAKGDVNSMHKLVYGDIKDEATRTEVLKHVATQAKVQAAHLELGTKVGSRRSEKGIEREILSDVDDTLTCSGQRAFACHLPGTKLGHPCHPGVRQHGGGADPLWTGHSRQLPPRGWRVCGRAGLVPEGRRRVVRIKTNLQRRNRPAPHCTSARQPLPHL